MNTFEDILELISKYNKRNVHLKKSKSERITRAYVSEMRQYYSKMRTRADALSIEMKFIDNLLNVKVEELI